MLSGINFKAWEETIVIVFRVMDLSLKLRVERPADLIENSSSGDKRNMERWNRLNCMSLMVMKRANSEAFRGIMFQRLLQPKVSLRKLRKMFAKNGKAETNL